MVALSTNSLPRPQCSTLLVKAFCVLLCLLYPDPNLNPPEKTPNISSTTRHGTYRALNPFWPDAVLYARGPSTLHRCRTCRPPPTPRTLARNKHALLRMQ
ncbi:hypothetical protein B0H15DRAFT_819010 [Mycena belliarum]|uniref:Secreted protein n=1 Tax=Mycena belliarum TaxID=1033014 RepID=A0AAD6UG69_9AGAR|nr:hypothetical protein B0H15DRAFT_819010 [Mycena belliae]